MRSLIAFLSLFVCLLAVKAEAQSIGAFGNQPPPPIDTSSPFSNGFSFGGGGGHMNPIHHETKRLTSPFGIRNGRMHAGVDMAACRTADGHPAPDIVASQSGKVMFSGVVSGYGHVVDVLHSGGVRSRYAHLARRSVRVGQNISRGQKVGVMGGSGGNYAVHLHYETHTSVQDGGPFNVRRKGGAGVEQDPCGYLPDCRQMQTTQASYNDTGCGMPFDTLPDEHYEPHEYMVELDTDFENLDYAETMVWKDEDYSHEAQFSDEKCKYKTGGIVPITIELPACEVSFTYIEPTVQLESVSSPSFSNLVNGLPTPEGRVFEMLDQKYGTDWRGSSSAYLNQRQTGMAYYYTRVFGITPKARFDSSGSEDQVKKSLSCDLAEYAWNTWEDMVNGTAITQALNMAEVLAAVASGDPMAAMQAAASNPQIQAAARQISVGGFSLNDVMQMDPNNLQGELQNLAGNYVAQQCPQCSGYVDNLKNLQDLNMAELKDTAVGMAREAAQQQTFNVAGMEMNIMDAKNLLNAPRADKIDFIRNSNIPGTNINVNDAYEALQNPSSLDPADQQFLETSLSQMSGGAPIDDVMTALSGRSTNNDTGLLNTMSQGSIENAAPGAIQQINNLNFLENAPTSGGDLSNLGSNLGINDLGSLGDLSNVSTGDLRSYFTGSVGGSVESITGQVEGFTANFGGQITEIQTSVQDIFTNGPEQLQNAFVSGQFADSLMNPSVMSALGLDPAMAEQLQTAMNAAQAVQDLQSLAGTFGDLGNMGDLSQLSQTAAMANPVMMYVKAAQELNKLAGMFNLVPTPEVKLDPTPKSMIQRDLDYAVSIWFPNAELYGGSTDLMAIYLAERDDAWYGQNKHLEARGDLVHRCQAFGSGGGHEGGAIGVADPASETAPLDDPYCVSNWGSVEPDSMFTPKSGSSLIDMSLLGYKSYRFAIEEARITPTKIPENELSLDYRETKFNLEYPFNIDERSNVGTTPQEWGLQEGITDHYTDAIENYVNGLKDAALRQQAASGSFKKRDGNVNTVYKTTTCKVVTCCDVYPGFEPKEPWKIKSVNEFK